MNRHAALLLCALSVTTLLCSCSSFNINKKRSGVCNTLNSDIIFNGGTSNVRQRDIQRAQKGLQQKAYDVNCDQ